MIKVIITAIITAIVATMATLGTVNALSVPAHVDGVPVVRADVDPKSVLFRQDCARLAQGEGREAIVILPKQCARWADTVTVAHPYAVGETITYAVAHKWGGVVWQVAR